MKPKYKLAVFILLSLGLLTWIVMSLILFFQRSNIAMLNPKGIIALQERDFMITATWLMLIVVIPVFLLMIFVSWRYRAGNKKATYRPDWDYNHWFECIWWGFPFSIVIFLSIIAWQSSHELDPYKPIESDVKPLKIQVVALQWKWLFIYPEQNIATVNFFQFPEQTPINFEITADAPMNSFWIPQLSGQIYAMPGMSTKLHLIANAIGSYRGSSANLSGDGFAGMTFVAKASSEADFQKWVDSIKDASTSLDLIEYHQLAKPSEYNPVALFSLKDKDLYEQIVMKYMMPNSRK